ncbi:hypothetical protein PsYK624_023460 [Phanerochaete sordida]|uniref:Uncharacterized protein n=1 Tax=Phanerochaete sordida TaxID=48140 RepID=A0A9P3G126_9APHY|nr:hypothetical protein PsYK624_023460 [Phanerochaete sordida]
MLDVGDEQRELQHLAIPTRKGQPCYEYERWIRRRLFLRVPRKLSIRLSRRLHTPVDMCRPSTVVQLLSKLCPSVARSLANRCPKLRWQLEKSTNTPDGSPDGCPRIHSTCSATNADDARTRPTNLL